MHTLKKISFFVFSFLLPISFAPSLSVAETASSEAPEGAEEKPKEESKEEVKSTVQPWVPVETKITELQAKIKSKEANILKLLEDKKHLPNNSPQLKTAVQDIVKEHKELRGLITEYEKNLSILRFRFPERNAKTGRTYDRIELKSLDDMEQAMGIDGKLNRNIKKMRTQFHSQPVTPSVHQTSVNPSKETKKSPKEPSIEDAGSVILQK